MTLREDLASVLAHLDSRDLSRFCSFYQKYAPHLGDIDRDLYTHLEAADQRRFVQWMLKRWARIDLVSKVERGLYDATIERVKGEDRPSEALNGTAYRLRDFASQGHGFKLLGYDWFLGVHDVEYNQYEHGDVALAPGDVIIDAGAFIGDTAVFFHHKLEGRCEVHSFELLDENLALLLNNLERNGVEDGRVVVNKLALTDTTGDEIVIAAGASQGSTSIFGKSTGGDRVQTVTLDDYVVLCGLKRVDFIKMDIEGSEVPALRGAVQTIRHFRPKLAICLYHKWDDAFTIPRLIQSCGVDYAFSFKWVQLSEGWEAVLLATPMTEAIAARRAKASRARPTTDPLEGALAALTRAHAAQCEQIDALAREKRAAQAAAAPSSAGKVAA
jgi:FkbM family methyltransferase